MSTVVHRQTLEIRSSVNSPDYSTDDWIINPDLVGLDSVPQQYWKVAGDTVVEMSASEKASVDANHLELARTAKKQSLETEFEQHVRSRYPAHQREALLSILAAAVAASRSQQADYVRQLQTWIEDGIRTRLHPAQDAADSAVDLAAVVDIELDLADWLTSDPLVTVRQALAVEE